MKLLLNAKIIANLVLIGIVCFCLNVSASAAVQLIYDPNGTNFTLHFDGNRQIILTKCTGDIQDGGTCAGIVRGAVDFSEFIRKVQTAQGTAGYLINNNGQARLNDALAQATRDAQDPTLSADERQRAITLQLSLQQMVPLLQRTAEIWQALGQDQPLLVIHEYRNDFYDILGVFKLLNRQCSAHLNLFFMQHGIKTWGFQMANYCVVYTDDLRNPVSGFGPDAVPTAVDVTWNMSGRTTFSISNSDDLKQWGRVAKANAPARAVPNLIAYCRDNQCTCDWLLASSDNISCSDYTF